MIYKKQIFELIRKEEVVIWAGAGLSLYAGYPTGSKLKDILYNSLSNEEKDEINKDNNLVEFAEEYSQIRSRNSLIRILKKVFIETEPTSLKIHEK